MTQHLYLATGIEYELAPDNLFQAVVTPFYEHIGAERLHQGLDGGFGKQGYDVDVLHGTQQRGSILLLIDGRIPFELCHTVIRVETDDDDVAK